MTHIENPRGAHKSSCREPTDNFIFFTTKFLSQKSGFLIYLPVLPALPPLFSCLLFRENKNFVTRRNWTPFHQISPIPKHFHPQKNCIYKLFFVKLFWSIYRCGAPLSSSEVFMNNCSFPSLPKTTRQNKKAVGGPDHEENQVG